MGIATKYPALFAGLVLFAGHASAEQWFSVAGPEAAPAAALVEIDLDSLRLQEPGGEGLIRLTHDVLQPHPSGFGYRSFVALAQFDCQRRLVSLASAAYYPLPQGRGPRLGVDSAGKQAGMPPRILEGVPVTARQALLKATCATLPPG